MSININNNKPLLEDLINIVKREIKKLSENLDYIKEQNEKIIELLNNKKENADYSKQLEEISNKFSSLKVSRELLMRELVLGKLILKNFKNFKKLVEHRHSK